MQNYLVKSRALLRYINTHVNTRIAEGADENLLVRICIYYHIQYVLLRKIEH